MTPRRRCDGEPEQPTSGTGSLASGLLLGDRRDSAPCGTRGHRSTAARLRGALRAEEAGLHSKGFFQASKCSVSHPSCAQGWEVLCSHSATNSSWKSGTSTCALWPFCRAPAGVDLQCCARVGAVQLSSHRRAVMPVLGGPHLFGRCCCPLEIGAHPVHFLSLIRPVQKDVPTSAGGSGGCSDIHC